MSNGIDQVNMSNLDTSIACTRVGKMEEDGKMCAEKCEQPQSTSSTWQKLVKICKINKELLPMKAHFFFFFGALAGVIPPLILYCQQLGASVSMVGVLFAVLPFVQCVSKPIAGGIADKWQRHKTVFLVSMVILTISLFSINFIPEKDDILEETYDFNENISLISCNGSIRFSTCSSKNSFNATKLDRITCRLSNCDFLDNKEQLFIFGNENVMNSCSLNQTIDCQEDGKSYIDMGLEASLGNLDNDTKTKGLACPEFHVKSITTSSNQSFEFKTTHGDTRCSQASFNCVANCSSVPTISKTTEIYTDQGVKYEMLWLWIGCIIAWSAYAIILSISDAILMNTLGENRGAFGYTRLYSSVGWGLLSVISAKVIDWASEGRKKKNYSPGFYLFFGFMICDLLTAIPMKVVISEKPKAMAKNLGSIFKRLEVIIFSIAVLIQGMVTGFLWTFIVVYANELNGSQFIIGLNYAVECFLSEIPFFMASGWIVNKLGHSNSMTFVLFVTGFKTLCYSFINDAWYMLIIAIIHGVTYGVMYSTMATYASIIAPPSISASIQGIFQALLEGAGVGFGNLFGGFLYEKIGGRLAFRAFGISLLTLSAVHWIISYLLKRLNPRVGINSVSPEVTFQSTNGADNFVEINLDKKTDLTIQNG